ncbi:hypothetical protein [Actinoalloteichus caeruleus]|uniref:hypothetical protein n=1 Tax=Actinoalloteichus cyanogriseus TaxID=2893586 RepID=UPI003BB8CCDA
MNSTPEQAVRAVLPPAGPATPARPHPSEKLEPTAATKAIVGRNVVNTDDEVTGAWLTRCSVRTPVTGRLYGHIDVDTGHGPLVAPGLRYLAGTFDHRRTVLCSAVVRHYAEFDDLSTDTVTEIRDLARRWRVRDFVPPPITLKRRRRRVPTWARVRFWAWEPEVELSISYAGRVSFKHADWARIGPHPTGASGPTSSRP